MSCALSREILDGTFQKSALLQLCLWSRRQSYRNPDIVVGLDVGVCAIRVTLLLWQFVVPPISATGTLWNGRLLWFSVTGKRDTGSAGSAGGSYASARRSNCQCDTHHPGAGEVVLNDQTSCLSAAANFSLVALMI